VVRAPTSAYTRAVEAVGGSKITTTDLQRRAARVLLVAAAVLPLAFALMILGPDVGFQWWIEHQLGGVVTDSPLLAYAKALVGFYLVGYAALCFGLALHPERSPWLVRGVGLFLIARGLQRNYLAEDMAGAFDIPVDVHVGPVLFTVALGAALIATTISVRAGKAR